jgi:hypothetical protein
MTNRRYWHPSRPNLLSKVCQEKEEQTSRALNNRVVAGKPPHGIQHVGHKSLDLLITMRRLGLALTDPFKGRTAYGNH